MSETIALFQVCAWPGCERTDIFVRGLCARCHMRARHAGILETFTAPAKVCQYCGANYQDGTKSGRFYCSAECQTTNRERTAAARRKIALGGRTCTECDGPIPLGYRSDAGMCSVACQKAAWYNANAEHCRALAIAWNRANPERKSAAAKAWYARNPERTAEKVRAWRLANVETVRLIARQSAQLRRARKRGAEYEKISLTEIWVRDAGICWLCEEAIDPDVLWPDPRSVSLDHIIPLARGGGHTAQNVALAHLVCNMRKGTKMVDQRMLG